MHTTISLDPKKTKTLGVNTVTRVAIACTRHPLQEPLTKILTKNPAIYFRMWHHIAETFPYKEKSNYFHCRIGCTFTCTPYASHFTVKVLLDFFHAQYLTFSGGGGWGGKEKKVFSPPRLR